MARSRTLVKICGITCPEDAEIARDCGADAIGLVFYPPSPRYIKDLGLVREIAQTVGPFVTTVGLFVDAEKRDVEQVLASGALQLIQFHGNETPEECEHYRHPYLKALRMKQGIDVAAEAKRYSNAQGILLDTYVKGVPGGTGESFNWDRVPDNVSLPIVLAGGLNCDNVAAAVRAASPYAVDVSGGVEASPGKKDRNKVDAFIRNVSR